MPGGDDSSVCGTLHLPFVGPGMRRKGDLGTMLLGVGLSQTGHVEFGASFVWSRAYDIGLSQCRLSAGSD